MKILVDTNVMLDVLTNRGEFAEAAIKVFKLCEVKKIEGIISALSIPNIVYIMRKELDGEKIKDVIEKLSLLFAIADLKGEDLKRATDLDFNDYEAAVQSCQAARVKADYIITRNIKDFVNSEVMAIKPVELLERV